MELILAGLLGAALMGLSLWVYMIRKEFKEKIEVLARESAEAFSEQNLKFGGLRDHVTAQNVSIDLMQKELAEFSKNMDADVLAKLQDRVGLVEMANGVRLGAGPKKMNG